MYRLVDTASRHCPLCGALNGVAAPVPVEPPQTAEPAQPAVAIRYVGRRDWYEDRLYGTGLIWHGYGHIQPIADREQSAAHGSATTRTSTTLIEVEPPPTAGPAPPAVAIRYVGRKSWHADQLIRDRPRLAGLWRHTADRRWRQSTTNGPEPPKCPMTLVEIESD